MIKLAVAICVHEHPPQDNLTRRESAAANDDASTCGLRLLQLAIGKNASSNGDILLFTFVSIGPNTRAIKHAHAFAGTDFANVKDDFIGSDLGFNRLFRGTSGDAACAGNVME